ncbi:sporulation membrane protein YtrI [Lederbergia graminis]|uniref:Sporulation membrane protein YtrI n=1 Tax=Lederbergia graminis TaxID=735518 RepID=A0ABW0LET0_9BACI|nr:sporulation membrane protein YtrI [Paenibacillus bovis]HLU22525.1 sporulation membrane protein YtrI [Bacillaceae bacterium]
MRIPPLYRKPNWQRFFSGAAIGGCISWVIFLYMFGAMQERFGYIIDDQAQVIAKLEKEKELWQEDYKELNEKNEKLLTVQNIDVKLTGYEKYDINDRQSVFMVQETVKEDLKSLLKKDLGIVYKNSEIIEKTITNRNHDINGKDYKLIVRKISYYTTINIVVELKLA